MSRTPEEGIKHLQKKLNRISSSGGSGGNVSSDLLESIQLFLTELQTLQAAIEGGTPGQFIQKTGHVNYEFEWKDYLYFDAELGALIYTDFGAES